MNAKLSTRVRKLNRMTDRAAKEAVRLGHRIGSWEVEEGWDAAVATCKRCRLIAAIDLTESPYLFGRALKRKCQ